MIVLCVVGSRINDSAMTFKASDSVKHRYIVIGLKKIRAQRCTAQRIKMV